ncbi:MAG: hypothetical protein WC384_10480 [Prolixibacteraceae bacterium]|jgi:hypothetical protein
MFEKQNNINERLDIPSPKEKGTICIYAIRSHWPTARVRTLPDTITKIELDGQVTLTNRPEIGIESIQPVFK